MAVKKVYFYKATINGSNNDEIPVSQYKEILVNIIERYAISNNGYRTINLTPEQEPMHIVWDIFEYNHSRLFGRLSKQKLSSSVIQRDYKTFEKSDILPVDEQQSRGIEQYTFGSFDYETGIFSIVSSKGAPNEKVICNLFMLYNLNYSMDLIPIPNERGIDTIYRGENTEITRLEVELPLPNAGVLANLFGWNEDEVVNAMMERNLTAGIVVKPQNRQSITIDSDESMNLIDKIRHNLELYKKAKMKAKSRNLKLRDYNFYEENFSYNVDIPEYHIINYERIYYTVDQLVDIYKQNIVQAFHENRSILIEIANK